MPNRNKQNTDTGGGAAVAGDVGTGGGDFAGRDFSKGAITVNQNSDAQLILFHLNQLSLRLSFVERDLLELKMSRYQRWFQTLLVALALLLLALGGVVLMRMR